jgi:hypothetical protein
LVEKTGIETIRSQVFKHCKAGLAQIGDQLLRLEAAFPGFTGGGNTRGAVLKACAPIILTATGSS